MSDHFERQPPPPPPSLDQWLDHSDRADNRREPFFVGREDEYAVFARGARLLRDGTVGGEAIIFQGAPGAGKSALMQECIETARARSTRNRPWVAQSLSVHTLANPHEVCQLLLRALRREQRRLADRGAHPRIGNWLARLQEARDELSARGGGAGGVRMGPRPPDGMLAEGAFKTIAGAFEGVCVVLFIDEAQNVPGDAQPAIDVLSRGKTGIDLLPVFFGLGHAARALSEKGRLSRAPAERVVELGALPEADVRESLAMTFHAYAVRGRDRDRWLDGLTALSQGWPQHLNRVAHAAARQLMPHGMDVDHGDLDAALAEGEAAKRAYYAGRLEGLDARELRPYAALGAHVAAAGCTFDVDDVAKVLAESGSPEADPARWLRDALRRGVIAAVPHEPGRLQVPVPSLAAYMADLPLPKRPGTPAPSSGSPSP